MSDEYASSASVYDAIYTDMKDYRKEAERVHELIQAHGNGGATLLDVACGTGLHDEFLVENYELEGLDYSAAMLAEAKKRVPDVVFHEGDMSKFDLGKQFDAVTCLFSAIGHMTTIEQLQAAINCMARHLKHGGVLIVEPFIHPDKWDPGRVSTNFVPDKKIVRLTVAGELKGHATTLDMFHFADWNEATGIAKFFKSHHEIAMYTVEQFTEVFKTAGLDVTYDEEGLMGRGVYIGKNRLSS